HPPCPPRLCDDLRGPCNQTADRTAEPLRQGDGHEIEWCRKRGERLVCRSRRVEQPGAVEVARNTKFARPRTDWGRMGGREDDAPATIVRVLDRNQSGRREDDMPGCFAGRGEVGCG